jgi:acylphosphatase
MKRIRIKVAGIVQGVGFRAYAKRHAQTMYLTGFTRNNADGSVTIEAQGLLEILAKYLELIESGPAGSDVRHIKTEEIPLIMNESTFYVTF